MSNFLSALRPPSSGRFCRDDAGPLQRFAVEGVRPGEPHLPRRGSVQRPDVFARQSRRKQLGTNVCQRHFEEKQQKHFRLFSRRPRND